MPDPLTPEDQNYFDNYFNMFASEGWKQFTEELKNALEQSQKTAMHRCDTEQKWFEERGMQAYAMKALAFERGMRAQYEMLTNPPAEDKGNTLEDY
jgi:hypothetical protein